ncbi:MAG: 16S rRNA processing protein RimM [Anaerolineaceae bacterium]|nr:16S rRNA processing protein RimM [Anaerolineaceae bacterium]
MRTKQDDNSLASDQNNTGSPANGEPVFLRIGKLRRAHGLKGEILMQVTTHFPERIIPGKKVYIGDHHQVVMIERLRWANKNILLKLEDVNSPDEIVPYRNQPVFIDAVELPVLPEGEYYHHQLLGLRIVDEDDHELGVLTDILETGANDVYVVKTEENKELLLPVIFDVVLNYALEEGKIIVRLPAML